MSHRTSSSSAEDRALGKAIISEIRDLEVDAGAILAFVSENYSPGDVFDASVLGDWAKDNGYVEDDE